MTTGRNDDLNRRITEKIQNQLLDILPEEDIRARVDQVIDNFFRETKPEYSGRSPGPSPFARIVGDMLEIKAKKVAENLLASPEWEVSIDSEMKVSLGSSLQAVLGVDPEIINKTAARHVSYNVAINTIAIIRDAMLQSGNQNLANALQTVMTNIHESRLR